MAVQFDSNLRCYIHKDFNVIFDEKGATNGVLRSVQWLKGDDEPDPAKAKLEIRKVYTNSEGERNGKGYSFSTDEGPAELLLGLIDAGFGDTKDIIEHTAKRKDFKQAVKAISFGDPEEDEDGEMFDMRDLLLNDIGGDDDDEAA